VNNGRMQPTSVSSELSGVPDDLQEPLVVTPVSQTYAQILKSTALIGGSSAITIAFGVVRTKAMALILGPVGVGFMGLYNSISDLAFGLAGLGLQSSGVRQIAEAVGTGDEARIGRTAAVLRRVSLALGLLGASLVVVFAGLISRVTFGNRGQVAGVSLLSLAVGFRLISGGQTALVQGMRKIADLARISVISAVTGTLVTIPLVYFWGQSGIVPSLVAVAAISILTSWWFSRKIRIAVPRLALAELKSDGAALLKLGIAFMASGFVLLFAGYAVRIIVLRKSGIEGAGLYQSAWALGGMYVGFILQSMGADFYPRLTAVSRDDAECNRLVNEQAHISLLLAGPGVLATLTLAPLVMAIFYSGQFGGAVPILRWICLGTMLQVVAWPMGFVVIAKGAQHIFLWTEFAASAVQVGLAWMLVDRFGAVGAGEAFFGLYVWHSLLIYAIVRRLTGFRWSMQNRRLGMKILPMTVLAFAGFYFLPFAIASAFGIFLTVLIGLYSARELLKLLPPEAIPFTVRVWLRRLRVAGVEPVS
jgi:antigen flippase